MSTYFPSGKNLESQRDWYLVDAQGLTVGRLASRIAPILMGKNKPSYTPFLDTGDHVIIVNADQVKFTGNKLDDKLYRRHSGYPGGFKEITARKMLAKHPERIVELAVKRMLPKTKLGEKMFKKLKVYAGGEHPHQAQTPKSLKLETR
jgi:large subunit ribosomal protein L13